MRKFINLFVILGIIMFASNVQAKDVDMSNFDMRVRFSRAIESWAFHNFDVLFEANAFITDYQTMNAMFGLLYHVDRNSKLVLMIGQQLGAGVSSNNVALTGRWHQRVSRVVGFKLEADLFIPIQANNAESQPTVGFRTYESLDFMIERRMFISLGLEQEKLDNFRYRFGPSFTWQWLRVWAGYLHQEESGTKQSSTNQPTPVNAQPRCTDCDCGDMFFASVALTF
ncbi:hypothetical protein HN858_00875 [Candidatus Falkowbacteria bacterium]|jgi:hypothetical protein|nr:hypothetical protein [Candidatus Falkowbacteria bacterium]MBT5503502.1 hypothetical protein [Candidatus Falkowbacteria bacterium]MBT6573974.1 hypothetical protein [Candidatus Falkowbacteria bacterium]MBT7348207.1 hypothetical protein [Candidatus Falkowbacteria bacterium]MBT7500186.1 hypothetical protein [Candidatus Falkowbacteria bacterium]